MARESTAAPGLSRAFPVWIGIGLLSFGGPAGQIALMQGEIVARRRWVSGESFDRGLAFSMMLPGPEAQQLATWLGWRMHGLAGGLIAGLAFILPGAVLMTGLAWAAAAHGDAPLIAALFSGVRPVVVALVLAAMGGIARRALKGPAAWGLAVAAFAAIALFGAPFPLVVAAAALAGLFAPDGETTGRSTPRPNPCGGIRRRAVSLLGFSGGLILAVFLAVRLVFGPAPFDDVARLFTTAALVTFGGAYAVLPFIADRAVETYGWLGPRAMLNGLAIAEATPGPLILANTYAGYFAGWSGSGVAAAGMFTAALATFYTFAPGFGLILAFAPAVERIHSIPWARRALAGISAAVVGVIANFAIWLAQAAFLPSGPQSPDRAGIALFVIALTLVFGFRVSAPALIVVGLAAGAGLHALGFV